MQLQQHDISGTGPVEPPIVPHIRRRSGKLKLFIVDIRPLRGAGIEQYWIDSRDSSTAAGHAARLAGVALKRVAKTAQFHLRR